MLQNQIIARYRNIKDLKTKYIMDKNDPFSKTKEIPLSLILSVLKILSSILITNMVEEPGFLSTFACTITVDVVYLLYIVTAYASQYL